MKHENEIRIYRAYTNVDQIGPNWIKVDGNGPNWNEVDQYGSNGPNMANVD